MELKSLQTRWKKVHSYYIIIFGLNKNTFDTQIPFGLSSAATKGKNLIKSDWAFHKSILDYIQIPTQFSTVINYLTKAMDEIKK